MFDRNRSGQLLFFNLISAISGNIVVSQSGGISGRKSIDGAALALLSGYVGEVTAGQGLYVANLFDFDINGNQVGFTFTASGCVPVSFTVITQQNVSGRIFAGSGLTFIASGPNTVVPPVTLSGLVANSGLNVTVPIATISGVIANSGLNVTVPIATISGTNAVVPIATISGTNAVVPPANLSGVNVNANVIQWLTVPPNPLLASGRVDAAFNLRTNVAVSGTATTIQLDAGAPTGQSGIYDGAIVTIVGGSGAGESRVIQNYGSSGIAFISPPWAVNAFQNSVFTIHPGALTLSGQVYPASGANTVVPPVTLSGLVANSGLNVTVPIATISGTNAVVPIATLSGVVANSGLFVSVPIASVSGINAVVPISTISGLRIISGASVIGTIYSGQLSGQNLDLTSGQSYPASGVNTVALVTVGSGLSVIATIYSGQLSGQVIDLLSGRSYTASGIFGVATATVASGASVIATIYSGQLSGFNVDLTSGRSYTASGIFAVATATVNSGLSVIATIYSGQLSGQNLDLTSGASYIASGINVLVPIASISGAIANSGLNVTVPIATISGTNAVVPLASISGVRIISGASVLGTIYSGQLSGFNVDLTSGFSYPASGVFTVAAVTIASGTLYPASGINVVVPPSTLSGVVANSGLNVTVPPANLSGVFASVPIASVSGLNAVVPIASISGLYVASGNVVSLLSGQTVIPASGLGYLASGSIFKNTFASGMLNTEIPYDIFKCDFSGITGEAERSLLNASRKLINKWDVGITSSGLLTVFKESDAVVAYTQNIVATSGAAPISSLDTN